MIFPQALVALKHEKRVRRRSWQNKKAFIQLAKTGNLSGKIIRAQGSVIRCHAFSVGDFETDDWEVFIPENQRKIENSIGRFKDFRINNPDYSAS